MNYIITLNYKEEYMPYYGDGGSLYPGHHGIDLVTDQLYDLGQPVLLDDDTEIGEMGETGLTNGVHTHVDKSIDGSKKYSSYRSPREWQKLKGVVIFAGDLGTAGKTVKIRADDGHIWRFLHFNKIKVKVGQRVGDKMSGLTEQEIELEHRTALGRGSTATERKNWKGKDSLLLCKGLYRNKTVQARVTKASNYDKVEDQRDAALAEIVQLQKELDKYNNDEQVTITKDGMWAWFTGLLDNIRNK